MATKFGVVNPDSGIVDRFETIDEAKSVFLQRLCKIARDFFSGQAYVQIEEHDDGTETWKNADGAEIEPILTFEQIVAALEKAEGKQR